MPEANATEGASCSTSETRINRPQHKKGKKGAKPDAEPDERVCIVHMLNMVSLEEYCGCQMFIVSER